MLSISKIDEMYLRLMTEDSVLMTLGGNSDINITVANQVSAALCNLMNQETGCKATLKVQEVMLDG